MKSGARQWKIALASIFLTSGVSTGHEAVNDRVAGLELTSDHQLTVVALTRSRSSTTVDSQVRAQGREQRTGAPVSLRTIEADWGVLEILTPPEDAERISFALDLNNAGIDWGAHTTNAIGKALSWSSAVIEMPLHFSVVALSEGVSYSHRLSSSTADPSLTILVAAAISDPSEMPAPHWYAQIARTVLHETTHLSAFFADSEIPGRLPKHNEEAAAYLVGNCGIVMVARELDAVVQLDFELDQPQHYLDKGRAFRPDLEALEGMDPSLAGWGLAAALVIAEIGPSFDTTDDLVDSILLPACRGILAGTIPDFTSGTTLAGFVAEAGLDTGR